MAGKKRSGLNKLGEALLALSEGRSDVPSSTAPLPLYHPEAHIHQSRRTKVAAQAPHEGSSHRRAV